MTEVLAGHPASPGVAAGPAIRLVPLPALPEQVPAVTDEADEIERARAALAEVADQLDKRAAAASGTAAEVLDAEAMMARDPALADTTTAAVRAGRPAPWAVRHAVAEFQGLLAAAGGYFAERAADLDDLADRAIALLLGLPMPGLPESATPYVLVAGDLSPADTAGIGDVPVLAIVTERGGPTSHTAILAKAAGLPAVVNCPSAADIVDGAYLLVDGGNGEVTVEPDRDHVERVLAEHKRRLAEQAAVTGPGSTSDGHPVRLYVNLGAASGLTGAGELDAEGVGLFRTEFLFLDQGTAPTLAQQRDIYRRLFTSFAGRTVVVRTLDAGSDKPLAFVPHADEPNPALGVRGYRTSAAFPDLLDTQLAAIAEASGDSGADVRVMAPMIATPAEAAAFAAAVRRHGLRTPGVMIEIPAAALRASELLAEVDFVSIGTNDLSQYTFAADRELAGLSDLLDPWQPALLRLIGMTAEAGLALGKPVGVCGEAAADPLLAPVLAGLGIHSLSMAPTALPAVRATLRRFDRAACQDLATQATQAAGPAEARALVAQAMP